MKLYVYTNYILRCIFEVNSPIRCITAHSTQPAPCLLVWYGTSVQTAIRVRAAVRPVSGACHFAREARVDGTYHKTGAAHLGCDGLSFLLK